MAVWVFLAVGAVRGQESEELSIRVKASRGPHFVGKGLEVQVGVVGAQQRPEVDRPSIRDADVWPIGTDLQPISASGIGGMVAETNLFVSRFRVVPRRAGTLEIPSIRARLGNWTGRSRPERLSIKPVPAEGRPAEFLGGVGPFTLKAEVAPATVRVGQNLEFRIIVTGPAAWGMTHPPELRRFDRTGLGLRIEPKDDELMQEPPSRTFIYRLRPTRPGDTVLPPVAIAAYDPASSRYDTRVTPGVPLRVVAVPGFDLSSIPTNERDEQASGSKRLAWVAGIVSMVLLSGLTAGLYWVRERTRERRTHGPSASRRYAAEVARRLGAHRPSATGTMSEGGAEVALEISEALIHYLEIGIGRPTGALTPEEARQGVAACTGSDDLADRADRIAARCDRMLYRDAPAPSDDDAGRLRTDARGLFAALGRVRLRRMSPESSA